MSLEMMVESKQLVERWLNLKRYRPRMGQREGAACLGVTEAELVAAHVGWTAVRLGTDWEGMLRLLAGMGPLRVITDNDHAVMEQVGTFSRVDVSCNVARVVGVGIDLRLSLLHCRVAFAVVEGNRESQCSLQFFDAAGAAAHKVFLAEGGRAPAFDAMVDLHESDDQTPSQEIIRHVARPREAGTLRLRRTDENVNAVESARWLGPFGASRSPVLRLVRPRWVERVLASSCRTVLRKAVDAKLPLGVAVGSRTALQIRKGTIDRARSIDGGFILTGSGFRLQVDEQEIASAWVVRGPMGGLSVTSLELYDRNDFMLFAVFGGRGSEPAHDPTWSALLDEIERVPAKPRVCRDVARWTR